MEQAARSVQKSMEAGTAPTASMLPENHAAVLRFCMRKACDFLALWLGADDACNPFFGAARVTKKGQDAQNKKATFVEKGSFLARA
ncbi:MAG: hypothetical protein ACLVKK_13190 [Ruthenibacterium sp.]